MKLESKIIEIFDDVLARRLLAGPKAGTGAGLYDQVPFDNP